MIKALQSDTKLRLSPMASLQSLGDGAVVLLADSGQLYTCNATTENILGLVDGQRSIQDIVNLTFANYDVERDVLEADVMAIAEELVNEGILRA